MNSSVYHTLIENKFNVRKNDCLLSVNAHYIERIDILLKSKNNIYVVK